MKWQENAEISDVVIDGKGFVLETVDELDYFQKRVNKHRGIRFSREPVDIYIRLWGQADDTAQRKLERRKDNYGINFKRLRAKGAE